MSSLELFAIIGFPCAEQNSDITRWISFKLYAIVHCNEIVSNKRTGVDVDKWDYLARDCLMLGMKSNFSHTRAIEFSKVLNVAEEGQEKFEICFRDKEAPTLYDMYSVRNTIHRRACHHKTVEVVQIMIADAIIAAAKSNHDDFKFKGKNRTPCTISEALGDVEAYLQMTDDILMKIYHADPEGNAELEKAKDLVKRLLRRKLYKFAGSRLIRKEESLKVVEFNYGMQDKNPLTSVKFFTKDHPDKAINLPPEQISYFLQDVFYEQQVLVYCKKADFFAEVKEVFNLWKKDREEVEKRTESQVKRKASAEHMQPQEERDSDKKKRKKE